MEQLPAHQINKQTIQICVKFKYVQNSNIVMLLCDDAHTYYCTHSNILLHALYTTGI